jgi:hypothetical protein
MCAGALACCASGSCAGGYRDRLAHELLPRLRAAAEKEEKDGQDGGGADSEFAVAIAALRAECVTLLCPSTARAAAHTHTHSLSLLDRTPTHMRIAHPHPHPLPLTFQLHHALDCTCHDRAGLFPDRPRPPQLTKSCASAPRPCRVASVTATAVQAGEADAPRLVQRILGILESEFVDSSQDVVSSSACCSALLECRYCFLPCNHQATRLHALTHPLLRSHPCLLFLAQTSSLGAEPKAVHRPPPTGV